MNIRPPRGALGLIACFLLGATGLTPVSTALAQSCAEQFWVAYDPQVELVQGAQNATTPVVPESFDLLRWSGAHHGFEFATEEGSLFLEERDRS